MDSRLLATIIYLLLIFKTLKIKDNEGILAGLRIIFYIPMYSFLYAIFWIIWLILN